VTVSRQDPSRPIASSEAPLEPAADPARVADRLHSAAIHLLRRLRQEDAASGLSAPRLSALSVIVFAGPLTLGELAEAEQVRPPTISRLVQGLDADGLVERLPDPRDGRIQRVRATSRGRALLEEGRARRIVALTRDLAALPAADLDTLARAASLLERLTLPPDHPRREAPVPP
jgi:DNA-binding MarR family transcriptional regulator